MGRAPCCPKDGMNKGAWTALEDKMLVDYIAAHGEGKWGNIPRESGLKRCGKSCRLRWLNYLRPDIKRGDISPGEEDLIIRLHKLLGNRWSLIAGRLPGRTDNEIKNYWNTVLRKKLKVQENSKDDPVRATGKPPVTTSRAADSKVIMVKPARASARARPVSAIPNSEVHGDGHRTMGSETAQLPSTEGEQIDRVGIESGSWSLAMTGSEEENELGRPTTDFSISELLASDFSESELWKLCQFENGDMDQQQQQQQQQPLLFSEELLKDWMDEGCFQFQP